jgi:hypothetical protein
MTAYTVEQLRKDLRSVRQDLERKSDELELICKQVRSIEYQLIQAGDLIEDEAAVAGTEGS